MCTRFCGQILGLVLRLLLVSWSVSVSNIAQVDCADYTEVFLLSSLGSSLCVVFMRKLLI